MIAESTSLYEFLIVLGLMFTVFGGRIVINEFMNIKYTKEVTLTGIAKILWCGLVFTIGTAMIILNARYIGKINSYGKPIPFVKLEKNNSYQIKEFLNNGLVTLKEKNSDDERIVGNLPEKIMSMEKGAIFELKDVPSITSNGRFIAPMLHVQ